MSEIEQLKSRINESGIDGIATAIIRDDYEPAGNLMINSLVESGEYITRKVPPNDWDQEWHIFKTEYKPY